MRIYLGAAPGVGKTFAMLGEGRRRAGRGTDVVVGFVETHGRERTAEQIEGLEVVPRRRMTHRASAFEEMDVDAVLARCPEVALVDELAHTNVPGSRNAKRWEDVEELLAAGIDVLTTLNIQHLESINDVVERITGVVQRETLPDHVVRAADQVELIDMTPEAIRRRMAHGNIYGPEKVDAALANYFRPGNLAALRELALLWVADQVDSGLEAYRERHAITDPWETRERVVLAVTGAPGTEQLIRRAARIAQRAHGELVGVHVRSDDGLAVDDDGMEHHRSLVEQVGGRFVEVAGSDVAATLVATARSENATQIVLGASRRSRWSELLRGSIINRVVRLSGPIDVHVISEAPEQSVAETTRPQRRRRPPVLPPRRRQLGWVLAGVGLPVLTTLLAEARDDVDLPSVLLLYLALAVAVAATGGAVPALAAAIAGFLCANWFFTPPIHTWSIDDASHVLALVVFLAVSGTVSALVSIAARRAAESARAGTEAETLARIAGSLSAADPLPELVEQLRSVFPVDGVALLARDGDDWHVEAHAGDPIPTDPAQASITEPVGDGTVLAVTGGALGPHDRRVLRAFAASLSAAQERRRLGAQAATAAALAQANELRSSLLQAVSHDLRTPLASIKASVSSLRQRDVVWTPDDQEGFLATVEDEADRLTALVVNLLDMSRISAGVVRPALRPVGVDEIVPAALVSLGDIARAVDVDLPEDLPQAKADPTLLERALANLVQNALRHGGAAVTVQAGAVAGRVELRVVDRGPGIPRKVREEVFRPFQRLGDQGTGVGLGLAVADGFVRSMGGELTVEDTPGGGTTMVIALPAVGR